MKGKIKLNVAVLFTIIMIGVCGCSMDNSNYTEETKVEEIEVILNDRQKSILEEQDLSTDYDSLTLSQQRAIMAIEEMLQYVEAKYATEFNYSGYSPASAMEKETLYAYQAVEGKEWDSFTVTRVKRDGKYEYQDAYVSPTVKEMYQNYIIEAVRAVDEDAEVKVYVDITECNGMQEPKEFSDLDDKVEGSVMIFVEEATFAQEDVATLVSELQTWVEKHKLYGSYQVVLLKKDIIMYLSEFDYSDYLSNEFYIARETIYLNEDLGD